MKNNGLEKTLEETWRNKERFYEDTKGLSMVEIIKGIEKKYTVRGATHNIKRGANSQGATGRGEKAKNCFT